MKFFTGDVPTVSRVSTRTYFTPGGTFCEDGCDCPHCPRTFARGRALKRYVTYEQGSGPYPYVCLWCHGYWHGYLGAHMAADHALPDSVFPMTCPRWAGSELKRKLFRTHHGWTKHYFQEHA